MTRTKYKHTLIRRVPCSSNFCQGFKRDFLKITTVDCSLLTQTLAYTQHSTEGSNIHILIRSISSSSVNSMLMLALLLSPAPFFAQTSQTNPRISNKEI